MLRLVRFCVSDRPCIALGAALIVSLSIALLAGRADALAIPEHHLDRIRGTNPNWSEQSAGSCTQVNVTTANNSNPPPPPGTGPYVAYNACTIVGAACIFCGTGPGFITYEVSAVPGPNPVNIKLAGIVGCVPGAGGTIGVCDATLTCGAPQGVYDCNTTGGIWRYQAGGGPP